MRGHHRFQMHSSPLPIVLFHPSICSPLIMQAEIQQVLTQPAQLRTSVPVPQHIIMKRAPAHQHDTSHFKSGPAPALKLMSPNLSIPSPSPAHGGPVHGCDCFLLATKFSPFGLPRGRPAVGQDAAGSLNMSFSHGRKEELGGVWSS